MYSQLPLNGFRVFEAVARLGSFQAAAAELHVTPSAISHQMRQLEDWFGHKLVERSPHGVTVLPQSGLLAQTLSGAFTDITNASRRVRQAQKTKQLTIAVVPSIATCWLIPKLAGFRELYPTVSPRVIYAIHGQPIDFDEVDVAISYFPAQPQVQNDVIITQLLPGESAPVCSGAFLELKGPFPTASAMVSAGLLHDTDVLGWKRWLSLANAQNPPTTEGPIFEDFNLLRAATLAGQGIALCPLALVRDDFTEGRLVQLSPLTILGESGYYLLHGSGRRQDARTDLQEFLSWANQMAS
jgi:LysR family transcriptional regulator, glycine cleavage system transcriptional activator